ncbi:MAG: hypothetical protein QOI12_1025 [Alphaproteobacteria bacterium]|nr:hypothetical protein [Alphaproteobacteria bacterium]
MQTSKSPSRNSLAAKAGAAPRAVTTALCLGLSLGAGTLGAKALLLGEVQVTCPIDGKSFKTAVIAGFVLHGVRLDLKPLGSLIAPNPFPVCPENGFVMYRSQFSDAEVAAIKPIVLTDEFRKQRAKHTDYYMAAYVKERLGGDDYDLAQTYLQASWEAERDKPQLTVLYRTLALERFEAFLQHDASKSEHWWTASMLAGELERLLGRFEAVEARFRDLPFEEARTSLGQAGSALVSATDQIRLHALSHNAAPEMYSEAVGRRT